MSKRIISFVCDMLSRNSEWRSELINNNYYVIALPSDPAFLLTPDVRIGRFVQ